MKLFCMLFYLKINIQRLLYSIGQYEIILDPLLFEDNVGDVNTLLASSKSNFLGNYMKSNIIVEAVGCKYEGEHMEVCCVYRVNTFKCVVCIG